MSSGIQPYEPMVDNNYGYQKMPNVITSMEYERLLSSTGPFTGQVLRLSDNKAPKKVAWIQCVGSRKLTEDENSYCSGVCCTYTQKQVILTKDHSTETECRVFHNDIRSFGKDYERYYQKAASMPGVEFIRSYVSIEREIPETNNVVLKYATPTGVLEDEFDMVVLAVGLTPPKGHEDLADKVGIKLNSSGFCKSDQTNPIKTSRPGIFVSGAFQGPTDIPEAVFTASGASAQCGEFLDYRRGKLSKERIYPEEKDFSEEEPRIGVFVCHCGANVGNVVDVPSAVEEALKLPGVVYATEQLFSCANNSAQDITNLAIEKGLNRVVLAACSPRTLEPLFRDTLREAGLNQYFCEMANIREHCSWVHNKEKDKATQKAKDIIKMSVARSHHLEPLQEFDLPVVKSALVVGGGIAGMTCALSIANQGHDVYLVEKAKDLGGMARRIPTTLEGMDVQAHLDSVIEQVYQHPKVHVSHSASIDDTTGYIGNFVTTVSSEGRVKEIKHGATVIAIGADVYKPTEYLYGQDERVMTHLELGEKIAAKDEALLGAESLAMIQCVGCRNEDRNYCSRVCCSGAVKNAISLKKINPDMEITIYFRDMMTYGLREHYYTEAQDRNVKFIHFDPSDAPVVEPAKEEGREVLRITAPDKILGCNLEIDADFISLAAAVIPSESTWAISRSFKVTNSPDGFFKEAHVKLRPVEFAADGIFLCGAAQYPKHISETINHAYGAASRVITLLANETVTASGSVCEVEQVDCVSCGACITSCNYGAIDFVATPDGKKAKVNPILCKGDGVCVSKCPTKAIMLQHFTDESLMSQIDAAYNEEGETDLMAEIDKVTETV